MNSDSGMRSSVSVCGRLAGGGAMSGGRRGMPIMGGGAPGGRCIGDGWGWNMGGGCW